MDPNQQPQGTIVDMGNLLNRLLSNDKIDQATRDDFWGVFDDAVVLSNLSERDIKWLMNQYDLLELRHIKRLKGHEYDGDIAKLFTQLRMAYFSRLNRAKGGFERAKQVEQITSNITQAPGSDTVRSAGYLSTLPVVGKYFR
jgi:hypothetical protein